MKLTESQQAAIDHRAGNLLVSASAGSGKTEVLARRCVGLIADPNHPCRVDELLVVTFTRAAATELRVRIGRMLRDAAATATDAALRSHLRTQEILVDAAEIGTIDAWCAHLVRAHFSATSLGVDPAFGILGTGQAVLLRGEIMDRLFDWIYTTDTDPLAVAARDWIARHNRPDDRFLRALIAALNRYRDHLVNPDAWLERQRTLHAQPAGALRASMARTLARALREECVFQQTQLDAVRAAVGSPDIRAQLDAYRAALAGWTDRLDDAKQVASVAGEIEAFRFPRLPKGIDERDRTLRDEIKKRWHEQRLKKRWRREPIETILNLAPASAKVVQTLLGLEQRYRDLLEQAKHTRGAYEFGDVQRMALDLLGSPTTGTHREPTETARALRRRYAHVLVDEYQDTSPVQVELLRLVTREGPGAANRFMVGDIKQSIYGFRDAEPRLFATLMAEYAARPEIGRTLLLSDSFRSHARLVDAFNALFATLFDPALGGTHYGSEEALRAQRSDVPNPSLDSQPRLRIHLLAESPPAGGEPPEDTGDDDALPLERIEHEAAIVAREIHLLLESNTRVPEQTADNTIALRPLRLGDVVVLLRSAAGNAVLMAQTLRKAGIPCVALGRESILDSTEVTDIRNVLALVANRRQDVPLAAYLRSPMGGLSAADLFELRRAARAGTPTPGAGRPRRQRRSPLLDAVERYRRTGPDRDLAARLDQAMSQLDRWIVAARSRNVSTLLRRILSDTGTLAFVRGLTGGQHRLAMLESLVALADDFAARGGGGATEFADYLDALAEQGAQPETSAGVASDVVRIMTIHAAKGLEFPVVFLCGTGTAFSRRPHRGNLLCLSDTPDDEPAIGLDFFDYPARQRITTAAMMVNRQTLARRELEEELRLLYVAATRARELLLIVGHTSEGRWNELQQLHRAAGGAPPLISRTNAASTLEWVMMGVAAGGLDANTRTDAPALVEIQQHAIEGLGVPDKPPAQESSEPDEPLDEADRAWIAQARQWLETPCATPAARRPAVLSVSMVKQEAMRGGGEDIPAILEQSAAPRRPALTGPGGLDGRTVGDIYHRFMQWADLSRLGDPAAVRHQFDKLCDAGFLTPAETALIDPADIAWFAGTDRGRRVAAADRCRREVPLAYALPADDGERTLLRGVIDCLCETNDGLMLLDYKTDRPRDEADFTQRCRGYGVQLQLYTLAARDIFATPVIDAALVFLCLRKIVPVAISPDALRDVLRLSRETVA